MAYVGTATTAGRSSASESLSLSLSLPLELVPELDSPLSSPPLDEVPLDAFSSADSASLSDSRSLSAMRSVLLPAALFALLFAAGAAAAFCAFLAGLAVALEEGAMWTDDSGAVEGWCGVQIGGGWVRGGGTSSNSMEVVDQNFFLVSVKS